ncbi:MAG: ribbon-helix-helix protein, CopG family [Campylobacterota bacterium]|nr:ribbon-helix-helix protein, CopG family [Campylobacterota bacterium]
MIASKKKSEKITVTIPSELKDRLYELKKELHLSASTIYKEALESYLKQKEIERWKKGAKLARQDKTYLSFVNEISNDTGDIYEY